jgi:hypothetical protein
VTFSHVKGGNTGGKQQAKGKNNESNGAEVFKGVAET